MGLTRRSDAVHRPGQVRRRMALLRRQGPAWRQTLRRTTCAVPVVRGERRGPVEHHRGRQRRRLSVGRRRGHKYSRCVDSIRDVCRRPHRRSCRNHGDDSLNGRRPYRQCDRRACRRRQLSDLEHRLQGWSRRRAAARLRGDRSRGGGLRAAAPTPPPAQRRRRFDGGLAGRGALRTIHDQLPAGAVDAAVRVAAAVDVLEPDGGVGGDASFWTGERGLGQRRTLMLWRGRPEGQHMTSSARTRLRQGSTILGPSRGTISEPTGPAA